jgi:hypothetical protein
VPRPTRNMPGLKLDFKFSGWCNMIKRLKIAAGAELIFSLLWVSAALAESPTGSASYEECMADRTRSACNESTEACAFHLSDSGQQQARSACLKNSTAKTQQGQPSTDRNKNTNVKTQRGQLSTDRKKNTSGEGWPCCVHSTDDKKNVNRGKKKAPEVKQGAPGAKNAVKSDLARSPSAE